MSSNNSTKRIAVLQLTRIGDVVQTYQAAKQLKIDHPEVHLTLIARKQMGAGLSFLLGDVFDRVVFLDVRDFIPSKSTSAKEAVKAARDFANDIGKDGLDALINLSFNKSSSYLTSLIDAKVKMGISRNEMNQLAINDKWSQYVYSSIMNSTLNPFNLVDIFKYIMGAKTFEPEYIEKARENKIVVHPFASTRKKRWGMHKWVDLLYKTLKDNSGYELYIVGAPNEAKEAQNLLDSGALSEFKGRIHNLTGKTSIEETYSLLETSKLLIGHDSMVSHLAAVAQTPTVVLSLGTVRPAETTPYQHNVLNIVPRRNCFPCAISTECELLPCHKDISHQLSGEIINAILSEKKIDKEFFAKNVSPFYLNSVAVYAPHFSEMGMELIDITESAQTTDDVFKTFYRIMWSFYLRGVDASYPLPSLSNATMAVLAEHQKGCGYVYELYSFGMKYAKAIVEEAKKEDPKIKLIQENINKLSEIDQLSAMTKGTYPHLMPIIDFFFVNKANAQGNNIIDITESNLLSFYEGQNLIQILFDLIERTIGPSLKRQKEPEL